MKVRAIKTGYDGVKRRRPGEVFEMRIAKGAKMPSWVVPVGGSVESAAAAAVAAPQSPTPEAPATPAQENDGEGGAEGLL